MSSEHEQCVYKFLNSWFPVYLLSAVLQGQTGTVIAGFQGILNYLDVHSFLSILLLMLA